VPIFDGSDIQPRNLPAIKRKFEIPSSAGTTIEVQDEGVVKGSVLKLNFTGPGINASVAGDTANINVPNSGGSGSGLAFMLAEYFAGDDGEQGPPGQPGQSGSAGATGAPGNNGFPGFNGEDGEDGFGIPGATGSVGTQGLRGVPGQDGDDGEDQVRIPGNTGATGATGATGPQGVIGIPGSDGDDGQDGLNIPVPGPKGDTGSTGSQGIQGPLGPIGPEPDAPEEPFMVPGPVGPSAVTPAMALSQHVISAGYTVTGGWSSYVVRYVEIAAGVTVEIGSDGDLGIG